jgi:RimJ/RimL family protein N-acetyltransferase
MKNYIYEDNLQSERLITRKLKETDIAIWEKFFEDSEAVEFLYLPSLELNSNIEYSTHMIKKQLERYKEERFGHQALIDKKTSKFIGICGLLTQEVDGEKEIEVGYHILKKHWRQGYAAEAAKLFIDYAFKNELTTSIVSVIDIENVKSQKVAEKNGLTIHKKTKWLDNEDVYIYRIIKDNWK